MRIVIAEDDPLLREGVALLLRAESLDVVATTDGPDAFLAAVDAHEPDVAIVDVRMPPTHTDEGITAAVEARHRQPELAVLVLSAYVEQAFATELLAGGATRLGYLLKERVGRVEPVPWSERSRRRRMRRRRPSQPAGVCCSWPPTHRPGDGTRSVSAARAFAVRGYGGVGRFRRRLDVP